MPQTSVLVIGSGPIAITTEACEFDYSGTGMPRAEDTR